MRATWLSSMDISAKRLTIVTGNYGSGKTEFSVNYIQFLAKLGGRVKLG
jgi:KaiC/GvpD/RAD55 family RecA-like ATPase